MAIDSSADHCNIMHLQSDSDNDMPPLAHDDDSDSDSDKECFGTQAKARKHAHVRSYYTPQQMRAEFAKTCNFLDLQWGNQLNLASKKTVQNIAMGADSNPTDPTNISTALQFP